MEEPEGEGPETLETPQWVIDEVAGFFSDGLRSGRLKLQTFDGRYTLSPAGEIE